MKRIALAVALAVAVGIAATAALYVETFHADLVLTEDGRLQVVETLAVVFLTPHHGIERLLPVSYKTPFGTNLSLDVQVGRVTMDGAPVPVTNRRDGRDLVLRIGDPERTITGTHVYGVAYDVGQALLFRDSYLQLYWNVTGNNWDVPIRRATASLTLPPDVARDLVTATSYAGAWGSASAGEPVTVDAAGRYTFAASNLNPGSGLTIDLAIPRSQLSLSPPSLAQQVGRFLRDNLLALVPIAALGLMIALWTRYGRDPRKGTIAPATEPPADLGPGGAGVLIDDRIDLRDISAMVIGLAVSGHLTIREEATEDDSIVDKARAWLGGSGGRYTFVRGTKSPDGLSPAERALYDAIFPDAEARETPLASLENRFYKTLPTLRVRLYDDLMGKRFYAQSPERVRQAYAGWGGALVAAGVALGFWLSSLYLAIALGLSGLVVLAFSPIMPRKTQKGSAALVEVLGLAEYIERAEVDRIEFTDAPEKSPAQFEKLLPYAVALGLTAIWVKKFEGLLREPPSWYTGAPTFNGHLFGLSLGRLASGMQSAFVTAPRTAPTGRSAWGGRSSFGGGFSGGGFGGGGGRGW